MIRIRDVACKPNRKLTKRHRDLTLFMNQWMKIEELERRHMLAAVLWDGEGESSRWHDIRNWGGDLLPGPSDEAVIPVEFIGESIVIDSQVIVRSIDSEVAVELSSATVVTDRFSATALSLTNSAVFSHPSTAEEVHKLELEIVGTLTVGRGSRIDVTGKGYLGGRTAGNTTEGGASGLSGGSHGGLGGVYRGESPAVFGDYADPNEWGSGGSLAPDGRDAPGASGGGIIRIEADRLELEGQLIANGDTGFGGGAGGSIYVDANVLTGSGSMQAHGAKGTNSCCFGGNLDSAGGGGGRIAVYARDLSGFDIDKITTHGGLGSKSRPGGGAGTVYVRDKDEPTGTLIIDAQTGGRGVTPLGLSSDERLIIPDEVVVRGANAIVRPEHATLALDFQNTVSIIDQGQLRFPENLELAPGGTLIVNGGHLYVAETLTLDGTFSLMSGTVQANGQVISSSPLTLAGGTLITDRLSAPALTLDPGSVLTSLESDATQMHKLEVDVPSGTITVTEGSRIDVTGKGYVGGRTSGNTTEGGASGLSGGSHGGLGGVYRGESPAVFGDYADPNEWGSGGSLAPDGRDAPGASGGGIIRIEADRLELEGQLIANGDTGFGGGAGGSIYVDANVLTGSGSMQAHGAKGTNSCCFGGNLDSAGGGGGRIAVYARDLSGFDIDKITTHGGLGSKSRPGGGAGTVYVRDKDEPTGTLIIDAQTGGRGVTPLGLSSDERLIIPDEVVVRGANAIVRPEHATLALDFQNTVSIIDQGQLRFPENLELAPGGTLIVNGGHLYVAETLTLDGTFSLMSGTVQANGQVISSSPLTLAGGTLITDRLSAPALTLDPGSVLTSLESDATQMHKLEVDVSSGTITVTEGSRIDVTGKGYVGGRTSGNTTEGGASGLSGGSHGGLGGVYRGVSPAVFGDYADPNEWGSGGSLAPDGRDAPGASGGGIIRIEADRLELEGQLIANGDTGFGGGAGGSIYVDANVLTGSGSMQAHGAKGTNSCCFGGNLDSAGGGGGRIAVYARDLSGFDIDKITTHGGLGSKSRPGGGAGTVYVRDKDEPTGTLIIDAQTGGRGVTPLGLSSDERLIIPDEVVVRGANAIVRPEHATLALDFQNTVSIIDQGQLRFPENLELAPGGTLIVNGGHLYVAETLTLDGTFSLMSGTVQANGQVISSSPLTLAGGTLITDRLSAPALTLDPGSVLTSLESDATQMHKLEVDVSSGTITVTEGSRIDVTGKGYVGGRTSGNTTEGGASGLSGGSHGGLGGVYRGVSPAVFGDYADPNEWGSGGSLAPDGRDAPGASGGGIIRIEADRLELEGQLIANGDTGFGGGAGGSIYVDANVLTGSGSMQAHGAKGTNSCCFGGNLDSAGGGGGRIAVYARDLSGFDIDKITTHGGLGSKSRPGGGAGTVYVRDKDEPTGTLIIDAQTGGRGVTPLGLSSDERLIIPDEVVVRGANAIVRPEHATLALDFQNTVSIIDQGQLRFPENLELAPGGTLIVNGGHLYVAETLTLDGTFSLMSGTVQANGQVISSSPLTLAGGTLITDRLSAPALTLDPGSVLTSLESDATQMHKLEVDVSSGTITVTEGSRIDVTGKGYVGGRTSGNTTEGGASGLSGGSHGGLGGVYRGVSPAVFGDYADPNEWGSGGSLAPDGRDAPGASGGGIIRIEADRLELEGQLIANGDTGFGGGAGGSIYVDANVLTGSGSMQAHGAKGTNSCCFGGNLDSAGGGGGRIAVYARDLSGFDTGKITTHGGLGSNNRPGGGAGTVHIVNGDLRTHVRGFSPAGLNNGHLGHPIDHFILHTNRPVDASTLSSSLSLRGPLGPVEITRTAEIADRQYRIEFGEQVENGRYHFSLKPTIKDFEGLELDQNANGILGELFPSGMTQVVYTTENLMPTDVYEFSVVLDTVAPRITNYSPRGDLSGTVEHFDIWFSEAIDKSSFTDADISITNPDGESHPLRPPKEVGLNRFRIEFEQLTTTGAYKLAIGSDITDLAGNPIVPTEPISFNFVPVDLRIESGSVKVSPANLVAGEEVSVNWRGRNQSGAALVGSWSDAVYLSEDENWDIRDLLLGVDSHEGGLNLREAYPGELPSPSLLPGVIPGDYYILTRADVYNDEKEIQEDVAINVTSHGPVSVSMRQLAPDSGMERGVLSAADTADYYQIKVEPGNSVRLRLNGEAGSGHTELYVRFEAVPTRLNYDFRSVASGLEQQLLFTGHLAGGTYYVLAYGDQVSETIPYQISAESANVAIQGISPNRHAIAPSATITITGAAFDSETNVEFDVGGRLFLPADVQVVSDSTIIAQIEPTDWPVGDYDVRVIKGAQSDELIAAFQVVPEGEAKLDVNLIVPGSVRDIGRATGYVEYRNVGNAAMPSPLLQVRASDRAFITLDPDQGPSFPDPWPPLDVSSTVQFLAKGSGSTPGILQPGDAGRVPFYYLGLEEPRSANAVTFTLNSLSADDVTHLVCPPPPNGPPPPSSGRGGGGGGGSLGRINVPACTEEPFLIDWPLILEVSRPASIPSDAWEVIGTNLQRQVGRTWGDYAATLSESANYLHSIGQKDAEIDEVWNFEVAKASGSLNPIRQLASVVDASSPAPGLPLVFSRSYGQPIASRFELGTMGRGWQHNWDIRADVLPGGDVLLRGPGGVDRYFAFETDNNYRPAPGDFAQLTRTDGKFRLTETDQTVWQFRADNLLEHVQDSNGNRITLRYTNGLLSSLTHSNGDRLEMEYNEAWRLARLIDPVGPTADDDRITVFEYDQSGDHLIRVISPGDRETAYDYESRNGLAREHALKSIAYPDNRHDFFEYDGRGRLQRTHGDDEGESLTFQYGDDGRVTVLDGSGRTTELSFGIGGQIAQVKDGEGNIVRFGYDDNRQLTELLGPLGEQYRYTFDAAGNITGILNPLRRQTTFAYESSFGQLQSFTDARGNGISYGYDDRGNLVTITYVDGSVETFTYDGLGNVESWTNRRGQRVTYTYNAAGQLTSKDYPDTADFIDVVYAYDEAGNLTSATDTGGTISLEYDSRTDELTRIEYPGGQFFEFEYDEVGRRAKRTDQDGRDVEYSYDSLGRLDEMTDAAGALIVDYDYDLDGRLERKTLGNGAVTTYTYDNVGRLRRLLNQRADETLLSQYDYTYDASGRRTMMTLTDGADQSLRSGSQTYGYDPLGQLTSVQYTEPGAVQASSSVTYTYDAAGNRVSVEREGLGAFFEVYDPNPLNQYEQVGDTTYEFDKDGNLIAQNGTEFEYLYDVENRLVEVKTPNGKWTYEYDSFGNRVSTMHNGNVTQYVVDPMGLGNVAAEYDQNGSLIARYDHGIGLTSLTDRNGQDTFYTFSAIGSTSELTDSTGNIVNSYLYDPFGVLLREEETVRNPFQFIGEFGVMNAVDSLEFMRARFFGTDIGRFTQQDPIGINGGLNLYSYASNQPTRFVDVTGLCLTFDPLGYLMGLVAAGFADALAGSTVAGPVGAAVGVGSTFITGSMMAYECHVDRLERDALDRLRREDRIRDLQREVFDLADAYQDLVDEHGLDSDPPIPPPGPGPGGTGGSNINRSRDPNDKLAPAGFGDSGFIQTDTVLPYTVRFENFASATGAAALIVIEDKLDDDLDLSTFELTEIKLADETITIPPGLDHYEGTHPIEVDGHEILAQIDARLNYADRELSVRLTAVDPNTGWIPEDPSVGLLTPNEVPPEGDGHVSFVIAPKSGLPSGTEIANRASIIFDYNDPIVTPEVLNTLDAAPPTSSVVAPTEELLESTFEIEWTGQDDDGGSGIGSFDIFVSVDDAPVLLLLNDTTGTSADFEGEAGHNYCFFSVATDNVGHVEAVPNEPDACVWTPTDKEQPVVTVDDLVTQDRTPALTGTIDDPSATIAVTINGTQYNAQNDGQGRWSLPDDTISPPLADGNYEIGVSATTEDGITGIDQSNNELTVDNVEPTAVIVEVSPNVRGESVQDVTIVFSEPILEFDISDLTLTRTVDMSTELLPGSATLSSLDSITWTLANIALETEPTGIYELTLVADNSRITDKAGNRLTSGATGKWTNHPGDSNADGVFNQVDIIIILQADKYQTGEPAVWSEGDWSGNGVFDQFDIVLALQGGNYRPNGQAASRAELEHAGLVKAIANVAKTDLPEELAIDAVFQGINDFGSDY